MLYQLREIQQVSNLSHRQADWKASDQFIAHLLWNRLVHSARDCAEAHNLMGTAWLSRVRGKARESRSTTRLHKVSFNRTSAKLCCAKGGVQMLQRHSEKSIDAASQNPAFSQNLPLSRKGTAPKFRALAEIHHQLRYGLDSDLGCKLRDILSV